MEESGFLDGNIKKREQKKETIKKLITPITQFFESTPSCSSKDYRATSPSEESNETEAGTTVSTPPSATQNTSISEESENVVNEEIEKINVPDIFKDPGKWPRVLDDKTKVTLTQNKPPQIKQFVFPKDKSNRSFSEKYYQKIMSNGEVVSRSWLLYSISEDAVFCFNCKLFSNNTDTPLVQGGFKSWQHLSEHLRRHEKSLSHIMHTKQLLSLNKNLSQNNSVDAHHQTLIEMEKIRWQAVLQRIIFCIKYLAKQNLGFRGSNCKLFEDNNGNFLQLIQMIAKFDTTLADHLQRVQNDTTRMPHYLGIRIQNEILNLLGDEIKIVILKMLNEVKYYSLILDCTPDASHQEQLTVILRFVIYNAEIGEVEIREHFLGFCEVNNTTGAGLTKYILEFLEKNKIDILNMRGQGYDNGANMKGKHNGLQKQILNINPRAFFVPCAAHTLNLVVNDAAKISYETIDFFGIIQELYNFFSSSTKRWAVLLNKFPNFTLKPLSDTRWESRTDALKPLAKDLPKIINALSTILEDKDDVFDLNTKHQAQVLLNKIRSYKFICSLILWHDILFNVNIVSKLLQGTDINILQSIEYLSKLNETLKNFRTDDDEYFKSVLEKATEIAKAIDIEANFPENVCVRSCKRPRMFDYESADETTTDLKSKFKINFFYAVLDTTLSAVQERFELIQAYKDKFIFLHNFREIKNVSRLELMKSCADLELSLSDLSNTDCPKDINATDLVDEIQNIQNFIETENSPKEILSYIYKNGLISEFPNLSIALRILLTLPVSVASGERSFSKLKLIKNYLRTSTSQDRLNSLALISIENKICENLSLEQLIKQFAEIKARKVNFY